MNLGIKGERIPGRKSSCGDLNWCGKLLTPGPYSLSTSGSCALGAKIYGVFVSLALRVLPVSGRLERPPDVVRSSGFQGVRGEVGGGFNFR